MTGWSPGGPGCHNISNASDPTHRTSFERLHGRSQSAHCVEQLMPPLHAYELEASHIVAELEGSLPSDWVLARGSEPSKMDGDNSSPHPPATANVSSRRPCSQGSEETTSFVSVEHPSLSSGTPSTSDDECFQMSLISHFACNWNYGSASMTEVRENINSACSSFDLSRLSTITTPPINRRDTEDETTNPTLTNTDTNSITMTYLASVKDTPVSQEDLITTPTERQQPRGLETQVTIKPSGGASIPVKRSASSPSATNSPTKSETNVVGHPTRSASAPWGLDQAEKEAVDPDSPALNGVSLYYSSKTQELVSSPSGRGVTQLTNSQKIRRCLSLNVHVSTIRRQSVLSLDIARSFTVKHVSRLLKDTPFVALLRSTSLEDTQFQKSVQNLHNTRNALGNMGRPQHRFRGGRMSVSGRGFLMRVAYPDLRCDQCPRIFRGNDRRRKLARHRHRLHGPESHIKEAGGEPVAAEKYSLGQNDEAIIEDGSESVPEGHGGGVEVTDPTFPLRRSSSYQVRRILMRILSRRAGRRGFSAAEPYQSQWESYDPPVVYELPGYAEPVELPEYAEAAELASTPVFELSASLIELPGPSPSIKLPMPALPAYLSTQELPTFLSTHELPTFLSTHEFPTFLSTHELPTFLSTHELPTFLSTHEHPYELSNVRNLHDINPLYPSASEELHFESLNCTRCSREFRGEYRRGNLSRHVRALHATARLSYKCRFCANEYKRDDARRKHEWKKHAAEDCRPEKRRVEKVSSERYRAQRDKADRRVERRIYMPN